MADNAEMSFWDHLEALRWMLARSFVAVGVLVIAGFAFVPWLFDNVVMAPSRGDFFLYRWLALLGRLLPMAPASFGQDFSVEIINIKLTSQFFVHMSLSLWLALLVAFPYIVFEVWRFVCPALYDNERKGVRWAFAFGTVMFYAGCIVGYTVVFPMTLRFLYTYELSDNITNQLALDSYMSNFLALVFMMGIVFELPLVAALLSRLGILTRGFFKRYRRHAVVTLLVVAAIITPSSDPFTLLAVFTPVYILWELSAFLVKPATEESEP